jgi:lysophospholipid acyltransferase (LPLAT)-like uncharacterized protein
MFFHDAKRHAAKIIVVFSHHLDGKFTGKLQQAFVFRV